jgi:hypothetical protein
MIMKFILKASHLAALVIACVFLTASAQAQSWLTNGLVAYYPFNGNANDASGSRNNLEIHGTTLQTDRFGNSNACFEFNGSSSDFLASTNPITFSNYTFSCWAKISSLNAGSGNDLYWRVFLQTEELPGAYYEVAGFAVNPGLLWYRLQSGNGSNIAPSGGTLDADLSINNFDQWMQFVGVFDGVNQFLYLNGKLMAGVQKDGPPLSVLGPRSLSHL